MARANWTWLLPIGLVSIILLTGAATAAHPAILRSAWSHSGGEVFTMSNSVIGNRVLAFEVGAHGALVPAGNFSTRGIGTGASLADAGALALTPGHRHLLVVNAGDGSLTVFQVRSHGTGPVLTWTDRVASRGVTPVSVTVHGSLVYVLNAGNATRAGNIAGFRLTGQGILQPIAGARQPLSATSSTGAAQVAFSPNGQWLVVSEKATSVLDVYPVNARGVAQSPVTTVSNGSTPYGFAFAPSGTLVVSDAGPGALTSYRVGAAGGLHVVSPALPDGQLAACWVAIAGGGWAFTSNAHSGTIGSYHLATNGALTLGNATAATTGAGDTDLATGGRHGSLLFVLVTGSPQIQEYAIGPGGSLSFRYAVGSLPVPVEGLAAF
ncbi:MAG TPA: beta-propeller fold lactonase family protein [Thermoplasmata archaeon]|nr:beta-propeller fold lactonase family protein [Thermoplasmata archaeon]